MTYLDNVKISKDFISAQELRIGAWPPVTSQLKPLRGVDLRSTWSCIQDKGVHIDIFRYFPVG